MLNLVLFALLAIGVSFLCSLLEAAFLSTPSNYSSVLKQKGEDKLANKLDKLKNNVEASLSSILTLNTIAHTAGAAGVGAAAKGIWGSSSLAIVSAVMTIAILVISEVIPKTLGANKGKKLLPFVVHILNIFNVILNLLIKCCHFALHFYQKKKNKRIILPI